MEQVAYFLEKLKSISEGDGNMLDNSMVMFGSGLKDGNRHAEENLPVILAGRGGGLIKPGRQLIFEENTPLANLYQTMAKIMGVNEEGFADGTGILPEIYA